MDNFKLRLNLAKLTDTYTSVVNTPKGNKMCVIIPVEENNIYLSERGGILLNATAKKMREMKYNETHSITNNVPIEKYRQMSKDERDRLPIIGGVTPIIYNNNNAEQTQTQTAQRVEQKPNNPVNVNDLPF